MSQFIRFSGGIFGKNMHFEYEIIKIKAMFSLVNSFLKRGYLAIRPLCVAQARFVLVVSCEAGVRVA